MKKGDCTTICTDRSEGPSPLYEYSGHTGLFDRQEIAVGKAIGSGTYCKVYHVKAIHLLQTSVDRDIDTDICFEWTRACIAQNTRGKAGKARYCIKFLKPKYIVSDQFEEAASALHNEIEFFRSVRHDNICAIRGVAKKGCEAYYCNGRYDSYFWIMDRMLETLEGRIQRWRSSSSKRTVSRLWRRCGSLQLDPSLDERMQVAYDMAQALEYIHSQRIVLCDVKPVNFGFSKENQSVQLFDAAMARRLEVEDEHNELENIIHKNLVPHRYMAPELLWGDVYGTKADVYSFLSIFYEVFTLKSLDPDVKRRCTMDLQEDMLSKSPQLGKIFPRGWSVRPRDRPSMAAVSGALGTILRQLQDGSFREGQDHKLRFETEVARPSMSMKPI
jgi:serine/threonine protein kinase